MKRVGILGGTFDPPHIGHLLMAEEVRIQMSMDEIWWMPNRIPPHKEKESDTTVVDRMAMIEIMVRQHHQYKLCKIELQREGPSYTADTMAELTELHPNTEFFFIIGEDSLGTLHKWHNSEKLLSLVSFIVIRRPGIEVADRMDLPNGITIIDGATIDVSSSSIREKIREKKLNRFLLVKEVYGIIKGRGLYE
ncbi:nicotinate-nucleotide adenylyltransferase [Evansella tamaricis]|uniref:Probable nicotinate-nucleotide adenylyltransferase n=1 Tax=Evansella tamaricis TaxID=2069301 RepID=A0ABS6JKM5_9BACI|nr:nicotinate-nucleotide adenylyltransferase [Evansella tamaricis]MBU9713377.1 nicotinate-nucleotide adenylyltransferase [Evansella tamaricis]